MTVGEFCNREVVFVRPEESIQEAVKLMRAHHVGDVVVVEERQGERYPVGILTDRDVVMEVLAEDVAAEALTVKDIMSFELLTVGEAEDVTEAVKRMRHAGVRRAPVVDAQGRLVGILTADDMLELTAEYLTDLAALIKRERRREQERRP